MADVKERYEGTWQGKPVKFVRAFSGRRFSDEECEALCRGETLHLKGLISKKGSEYDVFGKLQEQTFTNAEGKDIKYVGFKAEFEDSVPKKWCEHVFTEYERILLEAGKEVYIEGFVSKKGNVFAANVRYDYIEDGKKGIIPQFN